LKNLPPPSQRKRNEKLRLYWFSQTVGPHRGLEEAVVALGILKGKAELHLRGNISEEYKAGLLALAKSKGVENNLKFHPRVHPEHLLETAGEFDAGLAPERLERKDYALTVTNKFFTYLLAGLAVAATDTPGQREILRQIPNAGFLYPAGNPEALAQGLAEWAGDLNALSRAKQAAWEGARERFCWDLEKVKFLAEFEKGSRASNGTHYKN
jgi:glycosyltransferase involved in cell wall biosynthesis